jgi:hypothetical protein
MMSSSGHEPGLGALARDLAESSREVLNLVREAQTEFAPRHERLIAFVHIPKTAGATARNMLAAAYSRAALHDAGNYLTSPERTVTKLKRHAGKWEDWLRKGGRVTAGHVPYWLFREYLPEDTRYMTFLRDPIDRVLSHYYRHIHGPQLSRAERMARQRRGRNTAGSVTEALTEMQLPELNNLATRFLCGEARLPRSLPASAVDDAKANLRQFAFVGLQERFEESIVLLQRMLGLDLIPYVSRHTNVGRPSLDEIPDADRVLIAHHNELDAELYAFAQEMFEDAVARADGGLAADATRIRALSQDADDEALRHAREWLDRELPAGAGKPKHELLAAANAAGITSAALKRASTDRVRIGRRDGRTTWTRLVESREQPRH